MTVPNDPLLLISIFVFVVAVGAFVARAARVLLRRGGGTARRSAHGMGWRPDLPDKRDYHYSALKPPSTIVELPKSVDLRPICSPIEDQGQLGSCTAQALIGALEALEIKDGIPFADLSRLFVYYNERTLEGTVFWDSGAYLRDGIKTLADKGVCAESMWPYRIWRFRCRPNARARTDGMNHQIISYYRIDTLQEMKQCLADGFPFVFGFSVYESFESQEVASTGIVPMPGPNERVIGGHAVVCAGYDDATARFLCRNSWGTGWGQVGYFTMPYAYLSNRDFSDDLWTIRKGELA